MKGWKTIGSLFLVLALIAPVSAGEKYPDRPIDFLCCFGVGGGSDQMSRLLAKMANSSGR